MVAEDKLHASSIIHILDDFLFIGPSEVKCQVDLDNLLCVSCRIADNFSIVDDIEWRNDGMIMVVLPCWGVLLLSYLTLQAADNENNRLLTTRIKRATSPKTSVQDATTHRASYKIRELCYSFPLFQPAPVVIAVRSVLYFLSLKSGKCTFYSPCLHSN